MERVWEGGEGRREQERKRDDGKRERGKTVQDPESCAVEPQCKSQSRTSAAGEGPALHGPPLY